MDAIVQLLDQYKNKYQQGTLSLHERSRLAMFILSDKFIDTEPGVTADTMQKYMVGWYVEQLFQS